MSHFITFKGFRAIVLGYAKTDSGFVYLRMAGEHNAVKAIWACLVGSRESQQKKWAEIQVGPYSGILPIEGIQYRTIQASLPHGCLDLAMLHPAMTAADVAGHDESPLYFIKSTDQSGPPPAFFERLSNRLHLPLLPEWADWLWADGLAGLPSDYASNRAIFPLDTLGDDRVYLVYTNGVKALWQKIIKRNASLLRLPANEALVTAWQSCGGTITGNVEYIDVSLAQAVYLYDQAREVAKTASGEGRAAWMILREQLYGFLNRAVEEGLITVVGWDVKQEVEKSLRTGVLPYDDKHDISGSLIYAARKLKRHYEPGRGDGLLPEKAVESLNRAEQALVGLSGQMAGFVSEAEQSLYAYYQPIAEQLRQAMDNQTYPGSVGMIRPYQGTYYMDRVREIKTPAKFSFF